MSSNSTLFIPRLLRRLLSKDASLKPAHRECATFITDVPDSLHIKHSANEIPSSHHSLPASLRPSLGILDELFDDLGVDALPVILDLALDDAHDEPGAVDQDVLDELSFPSPVFSSRTLHRVSMTTPTVTAGVSNYSFW
ncbi:hypothetical protein NUW58_g7742 [Xylaria curta]|uniref:Uncharacterized protein n=1 Tax=Xylaria curta TaxID=42375 RepID=A0ACC1NEC1_9PEZI|nr:hypothetical protein NUW58_g7742 [Xylaria curta]